VPRAGNRRAFSLVEMVMVVVIMGTVSAIAVPRMTRAAAAAQANSLISSVATVRGAVERYYAEHGDYPGYNPESRAVSGTSFLNQLTRYTNEAGNHKDGYGYPFIYGPYLRQQFPVNPVNGLSTVHVKKVPADADPAGDAAGWIFVRSTGDFGINASSEELTAFRGRLIGGGARGGTEIVDLPANK
jgi:prepilin-type N-terminal cleavage/methylation domain-containing protein